jgi:hypothetical protein
LNSDLELARQAFFLKHTPSPDLILIN